MAFFTTQQKRCAYKYSSEQLRSAYRQSEKDLLKAANSGNEQRLKSVMNKHGMYEYALLYKNTPEYKYRTKKFRRRH